MDNRSKYNPQIHHRRSIRLNGYDYSNPGLYFITICPHNREHRFGYITDAGIRIVMNPELSSADNSFASNGAGTSTESSSTNKSFASNRAGASPVPTMEKIWQRNYYEHIIRNEASYNKIADYIVNNPANWHVDKFYS